MKIQKILLGFVLLLLFNISSQVAVKAEWVASNGTARGYSDSFYYFVESGYNKYGTQAGTVDDVVDARAKGHANVRYSDGQVWMGVGFQSVIKVVCPNPKKARVNSVTIANTKIATVNLKEGDPAKNPYLYYNVKGIAYGKTTLTVKRSDGASFTVPINIVPYAQIQNDVGGYSKDVIMGLGQTIVPQKSIRNQLYTNQILYYEWTSSNSNIASVDSNGRINAKKTGTATVSCKIYDKIICYNKWHYTENYTYRTISYSIKVQDNMPIVDIYDMQNNLLNQKIVEKEIGTIMPINPRIPEMGGVIQWKFTSSNTKVATIDASGKINAVGVGTTTITAKGAEQTQYFTLNVIPVKETTTSAPKPLAVVLKSISLNIPNKEIILGSSLNIANYYKLNPENTKLKSLKVKVSNSNILYVKDKDTVVSKNPGVCTVTIEATDSYGNVRRASVDIKVRLAKPSIKFKIKSKRNVITIKKVPGAKSYTVYRATKNKGKYKKLKTITKLTFKDKKNSANKSYFYKVKANCSNAKYSSTYSNTVASLPKTPSIKSIKTQGSMYIITIKGKKADGYEVYYGTTKACPSLIGVGKAKKLAFTLNLNKGQTYYFKVRSRKKTGSIIIKSKFSKVKKYKVN